MKNIQISTTINKPKLLVWKAITNHPEMLQWFFNNIPNFKATVGFRTWFVIDAGARSFYHLWEVTEVVNNKFLTVSWTYPDYFKESFNVTFKVTEIKDDTTDFSVFVDGIEKFEHLNIPELTYNSCKEGWRYFSNRLKEYLE